MVWFVFLQEQTNKISNPNLETDMNTFLFKLKLYYCLIDITVNYIYEYNHYSLLNHHTINHSDYEYFLTLFLSGSMRL